MGDRFVRYDWSKHVSEVLPGDNYDVRMMKTHEKETPGDFIWEKVNGGFCVWEDWEELQCLKREK